MSKKAWIGLVTVLLVGLLVLWYVRYRNRNENNTDTIQVGTILPLTGGAASLGKASLNGMQLAIDEFNNRAAAGRLRVTLAIEDDRAEPATGVSAFQKLLATQHIRLVLGPLTSGVTLAVAPLAERNRVVILSPGASAPPITSAGAYVFRNELSEAYGARSQAELASSRLNFKSVALLYVNNEYGVGTVRVFRERFEQLGGRIVADEAFNTGATDFRTALTKIKTTKPDAIFVVFQDDIVNIVQQRAELGLEMPIYTTPVFEDAANLKKLGSLAEGILYTYYGSFDPDANSGVTADFVKAYQTRFGEPPTYYAALGYDAGGIMVAALRDAQYDQTKVKDSLYKVQKYQGVTGETSFDQNGDVMKPVSLKVVRGGRFVHY
jgi:branched-chain amino acid transport system substrate-binding protein